MISALRRQRGEEQKFKVTLDFAVNLKPQRPCLKEGRKQGRGEGEREGRRHGERKERMKERKRKRNNDMSFGRLLGGKYTEGQ